VLRALQVFILAEIDFSLGRDPIGDNVYAALVIVLHINSLMGFLEPHFFHVVVRDLGPFLVGQVLPFRGSERLMPNRLLNILPRFSDLAKLTGKLLRCESCHVSPDQPARLFPFFAAKDIANSATEALPSSYFLHALHVIFFRAAQPAGL
jgi:hypothetical protein